MSAQVAHVVGVTPATSIAGTGFGAKAEVNGNGGLQEGAAMEDGVGTSSFGGAAAASGESAAEIQPFDMWSGQVGVGHGAEGRGQVDDGQRSDAVILGGSSEGCGGSQWPTHGRMSRIGDRRCP